MGRHSTRDKAIETKPPAGLLPHANPEPGPPSMRRRATTSIAWSGGARLTSQAIQFASTVVLARLLSPDEYGLVAIVVAISGFAYLFSELGLGSALIHLRRPDERDMETAFWVNALAGVTLTGVLCALAGPLSRLFDDDRLVLLIIVGSLGSSLSLNVVHAALLQRHLRFKAIAIIEITAAVASSCVAIAAAAGGLGAVSLLLGSLTQTIGVTAAMWAVTGWHPRGFGSRTSLRALWRYSGPLFGFNAMNYWARNVDNLVIGKVESAASLGLYSRAYNLMLLPISQVTFVVGRVLFPVLTRLRDEPQRLLAAYTRTLTTVVALAVPLSVGLAVAAAPFVRVVYGSQWTEVAPLLAILAASGPAQVIAGTAGALYQATGRTKQQLHRGVVSTIVTIAAVLIGIQWGVIGVAYALLVKFYLMLPVVLSGCWPHIGLTSAAAIRALAPVWISAAVTAAAGWSTGHLLAASSAWVTLLGQSAACLFVYVVCLTLFGRGILRDLASLRH